MSYLFPNYGRWPIRIIKGEGNYLWDEAGNRYLDLVSGIAVTSLGNVPHRVKVKVQEQLNTLWHCSNLFEIPIQEKLAEKLVSLTCGDRAFFCNSGAEANEAAIKLARRYAQKIKKQDRYEVITFEQSFHGRTLATLTATGQAKVKDGFAPLPDGFMTVPYNDAAALRAAITDKTCAVMLELVQGEGGVNPASPAFVEQVQALCAEHDLLLIVDEVQTGIGRTGKWFAYQHYNIEPDIITMAKGLGSGFPIGAIVGKEKLAEAFGPGTHGTTFGGNPLACSSGLATLETMEEEGYLARVAEMGAYFMAKLEQLSAVRPEIVGVRGKGLMLGVELAFEVADVIAKMRERGILLLQAGPNVLRLLPPFTVETEEIDRAIAALDDVLNTVTHTV
ncbi:MULTISPECIES: acetylornithine transaminase [Aneurinibacillus]|uniref:acetylornithine transaminase n=1 Tax=Aneurinibacillus TaxID=55079 RepID=UPI00070A7F3D|nr:MULTISPECIES: acetylornithine transaminase [Aneurinibacillus]AMA71758.1 acetylornithine aminotransferase [Aneurinibacillus sp. XH2]MED0674220.1 acetylornithine transaminase [Aneurinibacillus thermoaerophilus]MED0735634.1 acetylornithine transaminase [Aneurinibacillus thermoaerophilus]MED0757550.1 acetylornithine transaminase [Aneurinibacillus thermoaerophilus]MED0761568.1 acetylornithine transaminase [Aneurinibacillus thermoaerophilus]